MRVRDLLKPKSPEEVKTVIASLDEDTASRLIHDELMLQSVGTVEVLVAEWRALGRDPISVTRPHGEGRDLVYTLQQLFELLHFARRFDSRGPGVFESTKGTIEWLVTAPRRGDLQLTPYSVASIEHVWRSLCGPSHPASAWRLAVEGRTPEPVSLPPVRELQGVSLERALFYGVSLQWYEVATIALLKECHNDGLVTATAQHQLEVCRSEQRRMHSQLVEMQHQEYAARKAKEDQVRLTQELRDAIRSRQHRREEDI